MAKHLYHELTDAQQDILCELAPGPKRISNRKRLPIEKLKDLGLINATLGLQDGYKFPPIWSCSLTDQGRETLFPE
jgi:hypothetical protein